MAVLSAGDLARMRASALSLLPDTCTIQGITNTPDNQGGSTRAWGTAASGVACRVDHLDPPRLLNTEVGGGPVIQADWTVTLPFDQAIGLTQRIVTSDLTLEPVQINTGRSWESATRVLCREVSR